MNKKPENNAIALSKGWGQIVTPLAIDKNIRIINE